MFDQIEMKLIKEIQVEPGKPEKIQLPPVVDNEQDKVQVIVQINGV